MTVGGERLAEAISEFGPQLGPVLVNLHKEWAELWLLWNHFEELFVADVQRLELINEISGNFFHWVDRTFFEAAVLAVCRLTDKENTAGNENLTVVRLPALISDPALRASVQELVDEARVKTQFQRDWRNRRIGHNDLDLALNCAKPLEAATVEKMRMAIRAIFEPIALINLRVRDLSIGYEIGQQGPGVESLLTTLYEGREVAKERRDVREMSGKYNRPTFPPWLTKGSDWGADT